MPHGMMRTIAALLLALLSLETQGVERVVYYHNDALGSPIAATDAQGRVVWRKSYTPYGQPIDQAAPNEPGYTGKFEEPGLGIQNFGARWYDPRIGRFLAIDPAGFDPRNPQSFNRYAYANNNPYKYVDPDGRAAETALDVISLGLSLNAFRNDPSLANGLGLAYDAAATAVPVLPAGFGIIKNAANAAEAAGDAGKLAASKALTNFDPTNNGFLGEARDFTLLPGAKVDRFGFDGGRFLSPEGTPAPMRALRPGTENRPYAVFAVKKALPVKAGEIAPAYGHPGLGTQFVTDKPVSSLINEGVLEPLNR
ncbi:MAG: glycohydrolase toxin TNT-related protein [Gammaproteobacteria bacterium]